MGAVLQDAIHSFCECSGARGVRSCKLFDETSQWFASSDHDWPFAFESICAALGIEPGWIRRLLRGWLDGQGTKPDRPGLVPRLHLVRHRRPLAGLAPEVHVP